VCSSDLAVPPRARSSSASTSNLPAVVHTVLSRPWANYLVLTLLRQGEESDEWKNALRFADEFVWSAQPKTTESEHTRLRALLPQLEKALRHGLATVAYHDKDVRQLMQELAQFYRRLLDGQKVETKTAKEVIAGNATPTTVAGDTASGDTTEETGPPSTVSATQSPVEEVVLSSGEAEAPAEVAAEEGEDLPPTGVEPGLGRIGALGRRAVLHRPEDLGDRHAHLTRAASPITPGGGGKRPNSGR